MAVAAVDSAAVVVVVSLVVVATVVVTAAGDVATLPTKCFGELIGTMILKVPGLASEVSASDLILSSFSLWLWTCGIWDVQ